jgi:predicted nucleic acid-binding protein
VKYLLDINALIALAHTAHVHHGRASAWYQSIDSPASAVCTCSITELGFVRVSVQAGLQSDVASARKALAALKSSSPVPFQIVGDSLGADKLPAFAKTPLKLADGHLLELARHHEAQLTTLDAGIPGATVLP